jgi:hypothetical protein
LGVQENAPLLFKKILLEIYGREMSEHVGFALKYFIKENLKMEYKNVIT